MDINCDMGESYGYFSIGNDINIFPLITSCNIACGFHGGDPFHIENTIKNAVKYNLQIGAHPSYPDLAGFGRRPMKLPADELKAILKYQIAAVKGMTESQSGKLTYVKPHGALYNTVVHNKEEGLAAIEAVKAIDPQLAIMGLANSEFEQLARNNNVRFIREGFIDRAYMPDGSLMPRSNKDALINTVEDSVAQALSIIIDKKVKTSEGYIPLEVNSLCIHGDNPLAPEILQGIHAAAQEKNIKITQFSV